MPLEIERKFLVKNNDWKALAEGVFYKQGYILRATEKSVRIRIVKGNAFLTIKGSKSGIVRDEFEYEIPYNDAIEMLDHYCNKSFIEKTRYKIPFKGKLWEVDDFHGENEGLIVAEIELNNADESFEKPDWIGEEVSDKPQYFNANLLDKPFKMW